MAKGEHLQIQKELLGGAELTTISSISKELEIIKIDLNQKIKEIDHNSHHSLALNKKKSSQEELLLNGIEEN